MEDVAETIITTHEQSVPGVLDGMQMETNHYTVVYKTPSAEPLLGPFFQSLLYAISRNLYSSKVSIECRPETRRQPLDWEFRFIYDITMMDSSEVGRSKQSVSQKPKDCALSVQTLSLAFPWHFVLDKELGIIQLGSNLLKLFAPTFLAQQQHLSKSGRPPTRTSWKVTEFFQFVRPDLGNEISFETIFQRLNTPFLLRLVHLARNNGANQLAEVGFLSSSVVSFSHRAGSIFFSNSFQVIHFPL